MICNGLLRSKIFVVMSLCTSIERHGCIDHRNFQLDKDIIVRLKSYKYYRSVIGIVNATLLVSEASSVLTSFTSERKAVWIL